MRDVFLDLAEFEKACGNELPSHGPSPVDSETLGLRYNLIQEESEETLEAIDEAISSLEVGSSVSPAAMAEIADGLADLIYVCVGTAIRLGVDLPEVWRRVHAANMAKFGPGSSVREDGKRLKPPGWSPPDIIGAIAGQRPLAELYGEDV